MEGWRPPPDYFRDYRLPRGVHWAQVGLVALTVVLSLGFTALVVYASFA